MILYTEIMKVTVKPVSDTIDIILFHINLLGFAGDVLRLVIYQKKVVMQISFIIILKFSKKKKQSKLKFSMVTIKWPFFFCYYNSIVVITRKKCPFWGNISDAKKVPSNTRFSNKLPNGIIEVKKKWVGWSLYIKISRTF